MLPDFFSLTERRTKAIVLVNVNQITSIKDLRTDPACTEDFHYTVVRCGSDVHEVKETMEEIIRMLMDLKTRYQLV